MAGFKSDQVAAMDPTAMAGFKPDQLAAMDPTAMAGFKSDQVAALPPRLGSNSNGRVQNQTRFKPPWIQQQWPDSNLTKSRLDPQHGSNSNGGLQSQINSGSYGPNCHGRVQKIRPGGWPRWIQQLWPDLKQTSCRYLMQQQWPDSNPPKWQRH